jgi:hypothetical protein
MADSTTENLTADGVEKLFADLEAQPALIENADKMDAQFLSISERRTRRAALLTLEKSGQELIHGVTHDRGLAISMACVAASASAYAESLREFSEIMESASVRIRLALCSRPDMESVIKEMDEAFSAG